MLQLLLPYLLMFPAILIGAMTMNAHDVPPSIWGQNIGIFCIGILISLFVISKRVTIQLQLTISISILLLIGTFIDSGLEGVHRWVTIGPIRLYIASILLPLLLISLWKVRNWWLTYGIANGIAVLLLFQPDASQLSAFLIAMTLILYSKASDNIQRGIMISSFSLLIILSWVFLDNLAPVAHVEDIIFLVTDMGVVWGILGIISLLLLPMPFLLYSPVADKRLSQGFGIYIIVILISTFIGNFPVPLMGFGVSPIIGYFIALTWYQCTKKPTS